MFKRTNNLIVTMLMLLTFIGQVSGSSMLSNCTVNQGAVMDHSLHSMDNMNDADMPTKPMMQDCCSGDVSCSMMGCFMLAIPNSLPVQTPEILNQVVFSFVSMAPSQVSSALYRPPILG